LRLNSRILIEQYKYSREENKDINGRVFMPEEILENVYRIKILLPNSPLKMLNSYLIKGNGRNLLIDTGFNHPGCKEALLGELKELDADMSETDVLLTHLHADHTGLASEISLPGTRIFLSRKEIPWMLAETRYKFWDMDNKMLLKSGFSPEALADEQLFTTSRKMASNSYFDKYSPIDEGDEFVCGNYTLKAVSTAGHTPDHMCFWIEKQKTMFTGDHVLFDITPNITLWNSVEDSLGDYLRSLKKIDKYDVMLALPGHRETGNFHARIAELLTHHEKRLEECYIVVLNNPDSSVYDIAGKMSWNIRCNSWDDFPISQKCFAVGECQSHLRHLEIMGRVRSGEDGNIVRYRAG
jgi:glyoxylase-like metal-dependent hydrolase (beta-lactamase superfamily II)